MLITVANDEHCIHAATICTMIADAAKIRGTGIAKRKPEYIQQKMKEGKAIIALDHDEPVGFCYIESWENEKYVANSGLIVHPNYRKTGLAQKIKSAIFDLSLKKFPNAKLFGITTSMAVMKINSNLGYTPVTFSELTKDEKFWNGCKSCTNYDILERTQKKMCICTGMVCDLGAITSQKKTNQKSWDRFLQFLSERKVRLQEKAKQFPQLNKLINHGK